MIRYHAAGILYITKYCRGGSSGGREGRQKVGEIRKLKKDSKWYLPYNTRITAIHYARQYHERPEKQELIEDTVRETDRENGLYEWLLIAVTEKVSYHYLKNTKGMPCGERKYHELKREFFYRLSEKI